MRYKVAIKESGSRARFKIPVKGTGSILYKLQSNWKSIKYNSIKRDGRALNTCVLLDQPESVREGVADSKEETLAKKFEGLPVAHKRFNVEEHELQTLLEIRQKFPHPGTSVEGVIEEYCIASEEDSICERKIEDATDKDSLSVEEEEAPPKKRAKEDKD